MGQHGIVKDAEVQGSYSGVPSKVNLGQLSSMMWQKDLGLTWQSCLAR